jgi:probable F420-dependent oxidoreductase
MEGVLALLMPVFIVFIVTLFRHRRLELEMRDKQEARQLLAGGGEEQKVVLADDPDEGRARARAAIGWYLDTPNYVDNLRWLGFGDEHFAGGGSDELVDALVAAGDAQTIRARVQEHLEAGATQVAVQPLADGDPFGLETLRRLAPVLLGAAAKRA